LKSAMIPKSLPVPFPLLRAAINNEGPGRNKFCGKTMSLRKPERRNQHCYAIRVQSAEEKKDAKHAVRPCKWGVCGLLPVSCCAQQAGTAGVFELF